jgi:nitrate/TMAO reductase-like tetraheme cytochrome c subunit
MPVTVSCGTCHATVPTNREHGLADLLPTKFHAGLHYQHGGLSCVSCHNADNYDVLRLADGRPVPFANAEQLCAQCHGPQTRDYLHGSHGGMTGYWDRRKGERQRNTCTDCHDPHAPAYPLLQPVFQPRDRGALQQAAREAAASSRLTPPANATPPAAPAQSPTP